MENNERRLEHLAGPLAPVREVALRLSGPDVKIDVVSGALCISRRPSVGSETFALRIFPGITPSVISDYETIHHCKIAELYGEFLQSMNGAHLFEISLFGIPPSMAKQSPQIDRSTAWPLDIGTAQEHCRRDYPSSPADYFIGYGPYSSDEHVGYFLWPNGGVEAVRGNGERYDQWSDFRTFLTAELERAELVFPKYEEMMRATLRESSGWRGFRKRLSRYKF